MKNRRPLFLAAAVAGLLVAMAPLYGMLFMATSVSSTLEQAGVSDPKGLALALGQGLMGTLVGVLLCPIGAAIFIGALVLFFRNPSPTPPPLLK